MDITDFEEHKGFSGEGLYLMQPFVSVLTRKRQAAKRTPSAQRLTTTSLQSRVAVSGHANYREDL